MQLTHSDTLLTDQGAGHQPGGWGHHHRPVPGGPPGVPGHLVGHDLSPHHAGGGGGGGGELNIESLTGDVAAGEGDSVSEVGGERDRDRTELHDDPA